jgi:hypothetical protein
MVFHHYLEWAWLKTAVVKTYPFPIARFPSQAQEPTQSSFRSGEEHPTLLGQHEPPTLPLEQRETQLSFRRPGIGPKRGNARSRLLHSQNGSNITIRYFTRFD